MSAATLRSKLPGPLAELVDLCRSFVLALRLFHFAFRFIFLCVFVMSLYCFGGLFLFDVGCVLVTQAAMPTALLPQHPLHAVYCSSSSSRSSSSSSRSRSSSY